MSDIAIDVDSVLFPINDMVILPAFHAAGIRLGPSARPIVKEDITDFDYEKCLGPWAKVVAFQQFQRPDLYDGYTLGEYPRAVVDELRDTYDRVIAVTSPFWQHASSKWNYCLRAGFDHKDIVLCGDKSLVDFDVLLDDRPETIAQIGRDRAVVFDQPWNRFDPPGIHYVRAHGWGEVLEKIDALVQPPRRVTLQSAWEDFEASCIHGKALSKRCYKCWEIEEEL